MCARAHENYTNDFAVSIKVESAPERGTPAGGSNYKSTIESSRRRLGAAGVCSRACRCGQASQ